MHDYADLDYFKATMDLRDSSIDAGSMYSLIYFRCRILEAGIINDKWCYYLVECRFNRNENV